MTSIFHNRYLGLLLLLVSALVFIPFIGNCNLFDWDEVNFAECAREMLITGNYSKVQIAFQPFWEKPPLFIWLQALSMHIFGINEFAARFPNALCGVLTLYSVYTIGKQIASSKLGLIWALIMASTLLPHFYFKSGIIDPWFNLFIVLALHRCFLFLRSDASRGILNPLMAGLLLGLAVLTKGPVALLVTALSILIFLILSKQVSKIWSLKMIVFIIATLFISGSWFLIEWLKGNNAVITEFINYQIRLFNTEDSGHSGPWLYHVIVLLLGCFPASFIFILAQRNQSTTHNDQKEFRMLMMALFWIVLILFSLVKTKIIHYSSLCYFPLTYLAATVITNQAERPRFHILLTFLYFVVALIIGTAFVLLGFTEQLKERIIASGLIHDDFAVACLRANVQWGGYEFLIGVLFLAGSWMIYRAVQTRQLRWFYLGSAVNIVFIQSAILLLVPKIEAYTQRASIDFYKKCAKTPCYIETRGFKSYAFLFYSQRQPEDYNNPDQIRFVAQQLEEMEKNGHSKLTSHALANLLWIQEGKIDRPAFIVSKTIDEAIISENKNLRKLYNSNGYSFFVREPSEPAK